MYYPSLLLASPRDGREQMNRSLAVQQIEDRVLAEKREKGEKENGYG